MKARVRLGTIIIGLIVLALIAWQWSSHWSLFTGDAYPGYVNQEEVDVPEDVRAQWESQLNLALATLEQEPDNLSQLVAVATLERQLGMYASARQRMELVLEENQINPVNWTVYGDIAMEMEDYNTAERAYLKSLELQIDDAVLYKVEKLWREEFPERIPDIKDLYEQAIAIEGQKPSYLISLAEWYEEQGDYEGAISHMEVAVNLNPENEELAEEFEELKQRAQEARTQ